MDALQFEHISFAYGSQRVTLADISLRFREGSFVTVLGANGAGKTTLFRIACGILYPSEGSVFVLGNDIATFDRRALARMVAFVGQHAPPAISMSVLEYVLLGRIPYAGAFAFTSAEDERRAEDAMTITDCAAYATSRLNELSGGELQRVLVARALAQEPRVLLLDEPNSHLDIAHQLTLFRSLQAWQARTGGTVVASTHDLNLASMFSSHLVVLADGRLVAAGTPAEVLHSQLIESVFRVQTEIVPSYYGAAPAVHLRPQ